MTILPAFDFGERSAEDGEVLGEDEDHAAFDAAVAGDEAVAVDLLLSHAEVGGAVGDQLVGFFEAGFVEQELDALAGGHFAFFVLAFAALGAAAVFGEVIAFLEFRQLLFAIHGEVIIGEKQCAADSRGFSRIKNLKRKRTPRDAKKPRGTERSLKRRGREGRQP